MPTVSQVGNFYSGTYGFPLQFTLVDQDSAPINLNNVTAINLHVVRPELTEFSRDLPLSVITNIPGGVIQYTVLQGDLRFGGEYKFAITLTFNSGAVLVIGGTFKILQSARV